MPNNPVYVFDGKLCKFEGMTKEQIINAIVEATGVMPQDVDAGFISTILEQHNSRSLKLWAGSMAEYNALETHDNDTLYIIDGDSTIEDLQAQIDNVNTTLSEQIESVDDDLQTAKGDISDLQTEVQTAETNIESLESAIKFSELGNFATCTTRRNGTTEFSRQIDDGLYIAKVFDNQQSVNYSFVLLYVGSDKVPNGAVPRTALFDCGGGDSFISVNFSYSSADYKKAKLNVRDSNNLWVEPATYSIDICKIGL